MRERDLKVAPNRDYFLMHAMGQIMRFYQGNKVNLSCCLLAVGYKLSYNFFGDLNVYNPDSMSWTSVASVLSGTSPLPTFGHGFASVQGKLYVHGGSGAALGMIV